MANVFGPCTITHGGINKGKTSGGGELSIVSTTRIIETLDGPICDPHAKYGTGTIKMFELITGTINGSLTLNDFAELILSGKDFTMRMPAAKLLWPKGINFGVNSLVTLDVDFFFKPLNNNLITFS